MSENERKNRWLAVLVVAFAVTGFALAGALSVLPMAGASERTTSSGNTASAAVTSGPLTPLQGSASGLSSTGLKTFGSVTVLPEPKSYNAKAPDSVTVTLAPSQNLQTLINAITDVGSPLYRHYLSAHSLGTDYGNAAYAAVVAYFQSYGLSIRASSTELTLTVSGTVAQISAAFHTTLSAFASEYQSQGIWNPAYGAKSGVSGSTEMGPTFYANTAPAELPAEIASVVNGIAGLDGMSATPSLALPAGLYPGFAPGATGLANTSTAQTGLECEFGVYGSCDEELNANQGIGDSNFLWTNFGPDGYSCEFDGLCGNYQFLFPSTLPDVTGADNLWSGASTIDSEPDTGQGITIAVIEVGCAVPSDLSDFSAMVYGSPSQLPNRVTQIALNTSGGYEETGIPNTNLDNCILEGEYAGWTGETELDIEYASTMAPGAHIDVFGIPYPGYFSDFNQAYADIAQYLALGSTGGVCPSEATLNGMGMYIVQGSTAGACSVTITSNSYGSGEEYAYFEGSPMYITAEDQELELLNAVGVTNFFASGDGGGTYEVVNDFAPADSPGATSVGGAQVTATNGSSEFPVVTNPDESFAYCDGYIEDDFCYGAVGEAYFASATGIGGTGYWSYGEGLGGTYTGVTGGGFGQSLVDPQPWWQNALDTYSTGAKIDPVVSGAAAFNMSIYVFGGWELFYGGTSFACPIQAGEWALVEEQANVAFGNPEMGDINPLLYAAHNAYQAGASPANPYTPMGVGGGIDSAPVNSYTWYYYNLSIEVPSAPVQPLWFPSLGNPAGSGWNYLQGLGITNVELLDNELFGQTGAAGHSVANPAFSLELVTEGGLVPFTDPTLTAGTAYTFEVLDSNGQTGVYNVAAYSGQSSAGAYGGGTLSTMQTGSDGQFTYTPTTGTPPGGDAATTYGYFLVSSLVGGNPEWSFVDYAVQAPTPSGNLTLCVVDPEGVCQTSLAETTMFTTTAVGDYNVFGQSDVWLNGLPVAGAVVTQVAVASQFGLLDPTLPPADYAPGTTIGQTLSDARGEATFWTDALVAENNGPLYTDVYVLTATYDGLVSNSVTVFVEPQGGSFSTGDLSMSSDGSAITGFLSFADMKYATFVNVSIGSSPGQFVNYTCPLPGGAAQPLNTVLLPGCAPFEDTQFGANVWESGVDNGVLAVDLSTAGLDGPAVVSILAMGVNDVSFGYSEYFDGFYYNYTEASVQNPIVWQDPMVFLPAGVSLAATGTVTGTDTIHWSGTAYPAGVGTLSLVWAGGSKVLATYALAPGDATQGTYALDTTALADGSYSVVFTENAAGGVQSVRVATFYAGNEAAIAAALVSELQGELAADTATIASLQAELASANANVASLQSQLAALQAELASAQSQMAALSAEVQSLTADNAANASAVAALQGELATAQAQVTADLSEISTLQSQVQSLQSELNAKKGYVAPAWYDSFPGGGLGIALLFAAIGAAVAGLGVALVSRRRRPETAPSATPAAAPASSPSPMGPSGAGTGGTLPEGTRTPEEVIRRARSAQALLLSQGKATEARQLGETVDRFALQAGLPHEREAPESMYR